MILDTNVMSEMMKPAGQRTAEVFAWLGRQAGESLYTTTVTVAEILAGVAMLPQGRRKASLAIAVDRILSLFEGRCLPFDLVAAPFFAEAVSVRRRSRKPSDSFDLLIGAIARANGMAVVTRNTADFEDCGVRVIDPWKAVE